jgi:hypothetical protein
MLMTHFETHIADNVFLSGLWTQKNLQLSLHWSSERFDMAYL